jgi:heterotetrameric sarcosine oxidase gamma subunit
VADLGLPFATGGSRLVMAQPESIASVAPFRDMKAAASAALGNNIGAEFPATGQFADGDEGRVIWSGRGQWLVTASDPDLAIRLSDLMGNKAAVTDQSDAWSLLAILGPQAEAVMARLCPLDLSEAAFPEGSAARTEVSHMMALVTAVPGGFGVMVMRSFTATAVHDLKAAMASVAAQVT